MDFFKTVWSMIVYKTQLSSMNQFSDMLNIKPEITWIEFHYKLIFFC
jgi:hypothetical protein